MKGFKQSKSWHQLKIPPKLEPKLAPGHACPNAAYAELTHSLRTIAKKIPHQNWDFLDLLCWCRSKVFTTVTALLTRKSWHMISVDVDSAFPLCLDPGFYTGAFGLAHYKHMQSNGKVKKTNQTRTSSIMLPYGLRVSLRRFHTRLTQELTHGHHLEIISGCFFKIDSQGVFFKNL